MEYAIKHNGKYESIEFSNIDVIQTESKSSTITLQGKIDENEFTDYQKIVPKNTITTISLPSDVTMKLISNSPFEYTLPDIEPKYYNKRKISDFLYEIEYGNIDYAYADEYFQSGYTYGCSSIRNGKYLGRNFDWEYNNQVSFIVHTPTSKNRNAVLGVAAAIPNVLISNVEDEEIIIDDVDMFKLLPFYLVDGVNEHSVFCVHNIVPLDDEDEPTVEIIAQKEEKDFVHAHMLVRFVLDKFRTAKSAVDYLINYTTIYFTNEMIEKGYQSHFMIGDISETYIIDFINGEIKVTKNNFMTNFQISDVTFNKDKSISYPPTQIGINKYGFGLERWDMIVDDYKTTNTLDGMRSLLNKIKYSNTYGEPFWCSEIVKGDDDEGNKITVDTLPENCTTLISTMRTRFANKSRSNPQVWITTHASIYDIVKKTINIVSQEGSTEYNFNMDAIY